MIIIGYPGIGKSTLAREYLYNAESIKSFRPKSIIDLESSCFNAPDNHDPLRARERDSLWYIAYCKVAEDLSKQGHLVFVSAHADVQRCLTKSFEDVRVCCPSLSLRSEWTEKLRFRYKDGLYNDDRVNDKNYAAYIRAVECYDEDITALMRCGFPVIEIDDMDYDLETLIF